MLGFFMTVIVFAAYIFVVIAYGLRRTSENEARKSVDVAGQPS